MKSLYMIKQNTLKEDVEEQIIHCINVDETPMGGWYRQIGVLEGMVGRSLKRWYNFWYLNKSKRYETRVKFEKFSEQDEDINSKLKVNIEKKYGLKLANKMFPKLKKVNHESAYAFFDYIGYDYKNKKISNTDSIILIKEK